MGREYREGRSQCRAAPGFPPFDRTRKVAYHLHMNIHTKARTNVSINAVLLEEARSSGLKLSPLLETAIRVRLRELAADRWLEENRDAIRNYNEGIAASGVFSDGLRDF
jgi:antitoxin CcdA